MYLCGLFTPLHQAITNSHHSVQPLNPFARLGVISGGCPSFGYFCFLNFLHIFSKWCLLSRVDLQSNSLYTALQLVTLFFWSHYSKTKVGFFYLCVVLWCWSQMTSAQDDHTNGLLRSKRSKQLFLTLNLLPAEDPNRGQGGVCTGN